MLYATNIEAIVEKAKRYCNFSDDKAERERWYEEFGDGNIGLEDIINEIEGVEYLFKPAGKFNSPGYDMRSYALAWYWNGHVNLEIFIL